MPAAFETSKDAYLAEIDARGPRLEAAFQGGLNAGFRDLYILFSGACVLTLLALVFVGRGPGASEQAAEGPQDQAASSSAAP